MIEWVNIDYGDYYISFDYGGVTYFSEVFNWCEDNSDHIELRYSHDEHFPTPDGLLYYNGVYENRFFIYVNTGIG